MCNRDYKACHHKNVAEDDCEQLDELFLRRERRKTKKDKKLDDAVQSAKERAKAWSEAVITTHTALEAMRKLVADGETDPNADREFSSVG